MSNPLFDQALELLIFGMGTVFAFLVVLVLCVNFLSWFMQTFFPDPVAIEEKHPPFQDMTSPVPQQTLRIIEAAIHLHRAKQQSRD